jgi:hypothetical protein
VTAILETIDTDWSLVCVNDGSGDDTLAQLLAEHERDPRIKVIDLSRNFGKEYALSAGLDHCDADAVVLMDSDMQHPPESCPHWAVVVFFVYHPQIDHASPFAVCTLEPATIAASFSLRSFQFSVISKGMLMN